MIAAAMMPGSSDCEKRAATVSATVTRMGPRRSSQPASACRSSATRTAIAIRANAPYTVNTDDRVCRSSACFQVRCAPSHATLSAPRPNASVFPRKSQPVMSTQPRYGSASAARAIAVCSQDTRPAANARTAKKPAITTRTAPVTAGGEPKWNCETTATNTVRSSTNGCNSEAVAARRSSPVLRESARTPPSARARTKPSTGSRFSSSPAGNHSNRPTHAPPAVARTNPVQ